MICRSCNSQLNRTFVDLGFAPPSNSYLSTYHLKKTEFYFPLKVMVCDECWLVQTEDFTKADELFAADYAYFSSFSKTWLEHAKKFAQTMSKKFNLSPNSNVIEIAANDGYLLQYFKEQNIPCYGIEPTLSTANAAQEKGLEIVTEFFGVKLAKVLLELNKSGDLIVANNVLAHVPDINDFVKGISILLKPNGVATFEFPHLVNLIKFNQFDTIYHEHFSYLSLTSTNLIFQKNGLTIFDVEKLSTHGGSLRVYVKKESNDLFRINSSVADIFSEEEIFGIRSPALYSRFQDRVHKIKLELLQFLIESKLSNKKVAAYGAAAKGNTLLNFSGVKTDLIKFVCDANPEKIGKFMPGSHIPILDEKALTLEKPDYVIILPWNIKDEIVKQLSYIRNWDGKFVTAIPHLEVF